ncbi:MAG TPA: ABC transporter permease [Gemmatimonadales bacterium]|jgi:putative ABC transport system permease protein|nr:ABC transporter permease [Gemmatimonadales bacterium]
MSTLGPDLRYAWRALRRTPGFTVAAVAALALGIGATTTIFTVVNGVLLRPLQYQAPDRLANIWNDLGEGAQSLPAVSPADFRDYKQRSRTFEDFAAAAEGNVANLRGNLTGDGEPERADIVTVTANFFPLLGVRPALGRQFLPEEEVVNGPHVIMLSHRLWQRRFAGDPGLVGKTIQIDGVAHEVVGILPADFHLQLPTEAFQVSDGDLWAPIQFDYGQPLPRNLTFFTVFGRLAPGVTFEQAQAEMNLIAEQFRSEFKEHAASKLRIRAVPLHYDVIKHARPALLVLLGAVGMVLLIACANVANLLLVRGTTRRAEFALRTALGATRGAMMRQVLTESLLLALAGGGLGLGITIAALAVLRRLHPANLPRLGDIELDTTVLVFTVVICAVTSVLFGLVPALRAAGTDPQEHLKAGGRGGSGGDRRRARNLLIMAEVALSVVLLVGAGLLIRSFLALQRVDPGYDAGDVLTFELSMPFGKYPGGASRRAFFRDLSGRLEARPGVTRVGVVSQLPLTGSGPLSPFAYNEETARNFESVTADGRQISPEYFEAMDAQLLAGRTFTYQDSIGTPPVIIIDETLAKLAWPGENAVGKQLQLAPTGEENAFAEVVGVVEHMRQHDLTRDILHQIYYPIGQGTPTVMTFVVESGLDPVSLTGTVRQTIESMDPDLPVSRLTPMSTYLTEGRAQARFSLVLMTVLGGVALLLTAVGVFGVISYSVSQRTREFGIRLALGEDPRQTRLSVVLGGMRLVLISVAIGLASSLVVTRLIAGLLYEVRPADPVTFAGIGLLLSAVALLACYLPARRATRVDPALTLRSE